MGPHVPADPSSPGWQTPSWASSLLLHYDVGEADQPGTPPRCLGCKTEVGLGGKAEDSEMDRGLLQDTREFPQAAVKPSRAQATAPTLGHSP